MDTKLTVLKVEGMTCQSCVRHVRAALADIAGVQSVEVRLREGKVSVTHDAASAPVDAMIDALGEAGYASRADAA